MDTSHVELPVWRIWLMRVMYAFMAFGAAMVNWPVLLAQPQTPDVMETVVASMLVALSLLSLLAIRYPVQMLPVLMWELCWKGIWLLLVAWPAWRSGAMGDDMAQNLMPVGLGMLLLVVIPWRYVWRQYVLKPAEPAFHQPYRSIDG